MTHRRRIVRASAGAALAAALLTGVAACGDKSDNGKASSSDQGSDSGKKNSAADKPAGKEGGPKVKIPKGIPTSIKDVKSSDWKNWKNWAEKKAFDNPRIASLWTTSRMKKAKPVETQAYSGAHKNDYKHPISTPPAPNKAVKLPEPYKNTGYYGRIFFDTPEGSAACSGTVVADPKHPGKSNLVWTAGHCMHGGKGKGWYRNIIFVPGYDNDNGARTQSQVAPYGAWWARIGNTSTQWKQGGAETGNAAASYDYAVMKVAPPKGWHKSLEETVGHAFPVWFKAPASKTVESHGYPAAPPFNGMYQYQCTGKTNSALIVQGAKPVQVMGCEMTQGSSGGGWLTTVHGKKYLVGNVSLGDHVNGWQSSPAVGSAARQLFMSVAAAK